MHWHYLGRRQRLWHARNKQSPFISAWDRASASILSRFADGLSGSSRVTESEETLSRPEVLLYPYLYVSVKICRSLWPYIGLLGKQHVYGGAWSKVMRESLHRDECLNQFRKSDYGCNSWWAGISHGILSSFWHFFCHDSLFSVTHACVFFFF